MKLVNFIVLVANLSKTLHVNFYQIRSSIVEVMIKNLWCVFYASQCTVYVPDHATVIAANYGLRLLAVTATARTV